MKTKIILVFGLLIVVVSGCLVKSLHPFYKKENVVFDKKLIGEWLDQDSGQWVFEQHKYSKGFLKDDTLDNSYEITLIDEKGVKTKFNAHLFNLGNNQYLDFYPILEDDGNEMLEAHLVQAHSLAKIEIGSTLEIKWFNEEWLERLFEENRVKISHEKLKVSNSDEYLYVLTASTDELQKFLLKYGDDKNAFKRNWEALEKDKEQDAFVYTLTRLK